MNELTECKRYELIDIAGRGAMATVWRAHDVDAEMDVALKVVHEHLARSEGITEAFEREAELMRRIDHPGVVRVHGMTKFDGRTAIAMDWCPGGDLADRLRRRGPFSEADAVETVRHLLEALQAVHERGIIHRDVKPDNILFDVDDTPRLIDFGIGQADELMQAESPGQLGTVEYMAPERIDGWAVDARSDLYSAGVVLFELLCGHPPYRADTAAEVMRMHRQSQVADPRTFDATISRRVADTVKRAMAPHPEARFDDAEQMRAALQGGDDRRCDLDEHPLWSAVKRQFGEHDRMAAPMESEGHEWVVFIPPAGERALYGPNRAATADAIGDVVSRHADFARVDLDDSDTVRRRGIARGLSRIGAQTLVDDLTERGIVARLGRRPRLRRHPPLERLLNALRTLGQYGFAVFAVLWILLMIGAVFSAEFVGHTTGDANFETAAVVLGALGAGILAGTLQLPGTFREWWMERFSRDYLLDFCRHRDLIGDDTPVGRREFDAGQQLQSPRIRASYTRAINAILHLGERPEVDADDQRRMVDGLHELATQIIDVQTRVLAVRPVELSARIRQLDRRLASDDDIERIEDLMDEKARLRAELSQRDAAQQRYQSLAQRLHEAATRLERMVHGDDTDPHILDFDSSPTFDAAVQPSRHRQAAVDE